ncbi:MAG: hypothetical protein IPM69_19590 [Ignavibacteria bacterium]|nr:hypothetical protein [Ignavibacteria bacterium]
MNSTLLFSLLFLVTIFPLKIAAQTNLPLTRTENRMLLSFQYQHPFFKNTSTEFKVLSGSYDLSIVAPISRTLSIVGTLPFAGYSATSPLFTESSGAIANISMGISNVSVPGYSILNVKIFLPTAPSRGINSGAMMYGLYHRFYELEQYLPEALSLQIHYFYKRNFNGLMIGGVIGGTGLISTGRRSDELGILARYGVSMGYENKDLRIVAEFLGIGILTRIRITSQNDFEHFIALSGQWSGGNVVKPKVNIHLPLSHNLSRIYGWSLMIGSDVVLP